MTWRTIETAPPGERVLLWFPELGYSVTGMPEAYGYKTGGWKATHWLPLPPPPSTACKHEHGSGILDTNGNGEFTCHDCGHVQKSGRGLQPQPGEEHAG
jgi:hypothetical protein